MREIALLLFYVLLSLSLLFFGFFVVVEGGDSAIGSAIVMWMLFAVVTVYWVVPKFAPLIESLIKETKLKQE